MTTVRLSLGANLGNAADNVCKAIRLLGELGNLQAVSHVYRTSPWGVTNQPDFYNAAVLLQVNMSSRELLNAVKLIEQQLGRTPSYKWGPREIDIDILTFGNELINEDDLKIPHPELMNRSFVLVALAEIDSSFVAAFDALPQAARDEVQGMLNDRIYFQDKVNVVAVNKTD